VRGVEVVECTEKWTVYVGVVVQERNAVVSDATFCLHCHVMSRDAVQTLFHFSVRAHGSLWCLIAVPYLDLIPYYASMLQGRMANRPAILGQNAGSQEFLPDLT
jgi:hypothetical protein